MKWVTVIALRKTEGIDILLAAWTFFFQDQTSDFDRSSRG